MKVTSEQLLDLFGLKVGDKVRVYDNSYNLNEILDMEVVIHEARLKLKYVNKINKVEYFELTWLLDFDYEIIKPKPKLTDDEKEIVKAFSKNAIKVEFIVGMLFFKNEIGEQIGALSLSEDSKNQFENLKTYNIKELLDENSKRNV